jgi:hypothetical protein
MTEIRKCPRCGDKMEKGYVVTDGIRWSQRNLALPTLSGEFIVYSPWKLANVEACRCEKCSLVLFHYGSTRAIEKNQHVVNTSANH